jgi:arylsulfatase A-like enzyme
MKLPIALLAILAAGSMLAAGQPDPRPNVLFIAVDDLNHWIGHLARNAQTRTPNIDKLAARGVSFRHAYTAAPVCNPSRAALLSGLRPSTSGVYENDDDWRTVIKPEFTLITTFRNAGYYTAGAGKIYHESFARKTEWDDYFKGEGADPKPTGDKGVGGIKFAPVDAPDEAFRDYKVASYGIDQLNRKHDKPFLLTIGFKKPHMPWNVPRKYFDQHPLDGIELPPTKADDLADVPPSGLGFAKPNGDHRAIVESGRWKEAVQAYLAAVSFVDGQIGRLLDGLENSEYGKNTIVVFWGDHGWHLGEKEHWRKFTLWEEATRAPLIWVAPGVTKPGQVSDRTVDFLSIYPTLTDLAGITTPKHVQGTSIRTLLADPQAAWSQPALTTHRFNNHSVRTEGWRYIRYANGDEELYDEANDAYEWSNLAKDPKYAEKKEEFSRLLPTSNTPDINGNTGAKKKRKASAVKKAADPNPTDEDDD